uniref:Uncharacterized protein n=1 Tax=viral metagenome TaxID=1070528 RepID=A0A6C0J4Q7_9ZZZZ
MKLRDEYIIRKQMRMFYNNQNQDSIKAAYINSFGVCRFHVYLHNEFCERVLQKLIKSNDY